VLGDVVGPAADGLRLRPPAQAAIEAAIGEPVEATDPGPATSVGDGIVVLRRIHRFGEGIGAVASAIDAGDADAVVDALRAGPDEVVWIEHEVADPSHAPELAAIRSVIVDAAQGVVAAAGVGDTRGALARLRSVQVICAHRRGPAGASVWRATIERWLRSTIPGYGTTAWHPGQTLIVTKNDDALNVFNGDTGVIVDVGEGRLRVAFDRHGQVLQISPTRLDATEALSAMTIHKAQGSQFGTAIVVLPAPSSRVLTRELLYTGITRAQERLVLVGSEASVRAAVARPIARASGLRDALWP
jgi:exodeoxyribonuclease V alpha subunit